MVTIDSIKDKIRAILIEKDGNVQAHELKFIVDEAKEFGITDKQIAKLVPEIDRSINWEQIRKQKEETVKRQLELEQFTKQEEEKKQNAPEFIAALLQYSFSDGMVESKELETIFNKAIELSQDENKLARDIKKLIDENKFKPYPNPKLETSTLKETLLSTNWYNEKQYIKLTTPAPPPPKPFPWLVLITAIILIMAACGGGYYQMHYKPMARDRDAPRYYTFASNVIFRSSKESGADYNKIMTLPYGSELITYDYGPEWVYGKTNEKEGYVSTKLTLDKKDFYLLNSIFGDNDSKATIETIKCRKSLLKYFKDKNYIGKMDETLQREAFGYLQTMKEVWQVFAKGKDIKPNTVAYPRIFNKSSKFTDFAVILKNIKTNHRRLLVFTFSDTEEATLIIDEIAPDLGDIIVTKAKKTGIQSIKIE